MQRDIRESVAVADAPAACTVALDGEGTGGEECDSCLVVDSKEGQMAWACDEPAAADGTSR